MMDALALLPIFLVGLLGSIHCVGMCGGIVGAFSAGRALPAQRSGSGGAVTARRVIAIHLERDASPAAALASQAAFSLAYNSGRLLSYSIAGALGAGLVQSARMFAWLSSVQIIGYWVANLLLIALGLYLMNIWHGVTRIESWGRVLWARLQPLMPRLLPIDHPGKAFLLGGLWGWVPCGMVYSVLLTAMSTGSAQSGAMVMFAFGLGTLPMLFGLGMLGTGVLSWVRKPAVRTVCGLVVAGFGVIGLFRVTTGLSLGWIDALCIPLHAFGAGH